MLAKFPWCFGCVLCDCYVSLVLVDGFFVFWRVELVIDEFLWFFGSFLGA